MPPNPSKLSIEDAANQFLSFGIGKEGSGAVIIRSGELGAYVTTRQKGGQWIPAFFVENDDAHVVDVTGAGNSFLGGLVAGLHYENNDVYEAVFYGAVSASFAIEQMGLPLRTGYMYRTGQGEMWNNDSPRRRLEELKSRVAK